MHLKAPINKNYCATVVEIPNLYPLIGCDNVVGTKIFGSQVIVGKDTGENMRGLYFPVETQLTSDFLSHNNLFRDPLLNVDQTQKGYFELNGRIRAVKFRGHKSEGFFIPLASLLPFVDVKDLSTMPIGEEFDEINGVSICKKYTINTSRTAGSGNKEGRRADVRISRIVKGQVHLHDDTDNLRKNLHKVTPYDIISITDKYHGTSFGVANVLTNKKLKWYERLLLKLKVAIVTTCYDLVYFSRRVIKNEYETKAHTHFYKYDLWADIKESLKEKIEKGITLYGEAVGFTKTGEYIQDGYDYGSKPKEFRTFIYAITSTNTDGVVTRFSRGQVKDYCLKHNLETPREFYYGPAMYVVDMNHCEEEWSKCFLEKLEYLYLEKDCIVCKNKVPAEGIVVAVDDLQEYKGYKLKSYRFLERETKQLDEGKINMESQESELVEE